LEEQGPDELDLESQSTPYSPVKIIIHFRLKAILFHSNLFEIKFYLHHLNVLLLWRRVAIADLVEPTPPGTTWGYQRQGKVFGDRE